MKMRTKDIPNILSIVRILLVPVFVYLFVTRQLKSAVVIFILSGFTDVMDGYIARKYNFISNLGKFLDPFADKLTQFTAFICLYTADIVPLWMPCVYFCKEIGTAIGAAFVLRNRKIVVKSNIFGKLATFFAFTFVCFAIVCGTKMPDGVIDFMCVAICLYFVFSCIMYIKLYLKTTDEKINDEKDSTEKNIECA